MKCHLALLGLLCAALAAPSRADTSGVSPTGFISSFREEVKAAPDDTWKAIAQLPKWWSDAHTYSGRASNMSLDLVAGSADAGLETLAPAVDQVLAAQYRRLKTLAETGKPE